MDDALILDVLAEREAYRERYWACKDPIADERLAWRAHSLRNTVHLLPGSSILELGAGSGRFTRQLQHITHGESSITAVSFDPNLARPASLDASVEFVATRDVVSALAGRSFDVVVGMDLLDRRTSAWLLERVHGWLRPGGQILFYESNPWNPVLNLRRVASLFGATHDPRRLHNQPQFLAMIRAQGFEREFAVYNDFVFPPLTRSLVWLLRNLSILFENAPVVRAIAGSILIHAQKPPCDLQSSAISLCRHDAFVNRLSVVIPCRNEEANVRALTSSLIRHYDRYVKEIVLVDDGSSDRTRDEIEALAAADARVVPVIRRPPHGVGRALTDGLRAATGDWILTLDCDFQHLLPDVRELFDAAASGADVAVGSRFSRRSVLLNYPFAKIVANRTFHVLAKLLLRRDVRDLTNNLKLMHRAVAEDLILAEPHFAANAETGFEPLIAGWRVDEVPISWINRTAEMGRSSFKLPRVGGGYARTLWHLVLKCWFGRGRYRALRVHAVQRSTRRLEPAAPPVENG